MDLIAILKLVRGAGHWSLADFIQHVTSGGLHKLPTNRWSAKIDGVAQPSGAVTRHDVGGALPAGVWAEWDITGTGTVRASSTGGNNVSLTIGGVPKPDAICIISSGSEGQGFWNAFLVIKLRWTENGTTHTIRLAGKIT